MAVSNRQKRLQFEEALRQSGAATPPLMPPPPTVPPPPTAAPPSATAPQAPASGVVSEAYAGAPGTEALVNPPPTPVYPPTGEPERMSGPIPDPGQGDTFSDYIEEQDFSSQVPPLPNLSPYGFGQYGGYNWMNHPAVQEYMQENYPNYQPQQSNFIASNQEAIPEPLRDNFGLPPSNFPASDTYIPPPGPFGSFGNFGGAGQTYVDPTGVEYQIPSGESTPSAPAVTPPTTAATPPPTTPTASGGIGALQSMATIAPANLATPTITRDPIAPPMNPAQKEWARQMVRDVSIGDNFGRSEPVDVLGGLARARDRFNSGGFGGPVTPPTPPAPIVAPIANEPAAFGNFGGFGGFGNLGGITSPSVTPPTQLGGSVATPRPPVRISPAPVTGAPPVSADVTQPPPINMPPPPVQAPPPMGNYGGFGGGLGGFFNSSPIAPPRPSPAPNPGFAAAPGYLNLVPDDPRPFGGVPVGLGDKPGRSSFGVPANSRNFLGGFNFNLGGIVDAFSPQYR